MNYKTHLLGGLLAGSIVAFKLNMQINNLPVILAASSFGSLLPDLDHKMSYISKRMQTTSYVTRKITKHRGITHSPVFMALVVIVLNEQINISINDIKSKVIYISLYAGIISHIFLDMFNKRGVPLFFPLSRNNISFGNIKTGGFMENIVRIFISIFLVILQINFYVSYNN